jgi:hypothetical protein
VVVVAAGSAWIALRYGQNQADPKGALGAIFLLIGAFMAVLFVLQWLDIGRAERRDALGSSGELWRALAVGPVDDDALAARRETWGVARQSVSTGALITLLIFLSVPPIYLLNTWVPFIVGTPVIVGIALWKSLRLLAPGGDFDQAYERAGRALAPLGLRVTEHPSLSIEPKGVAPYRMGPALHGALVLDGERHGRPVHVEMPVGAGVRSPSQVTVRVPVRSSFELRVREGKVRAPKDAPASVRETLDGVPASTDWTGLRGHAGPDGITIARRNAGQEDWLRDLWLAERLAAHLE